MPDIEMLHSLLDYNPETGIFTWKKAYGRGVSHSKPGDRAGYRNWCGHRIITVDRKKYREHRLAFEFLGFSIPDGFEIDHINGLYDDNRISNLRLATHQQNLANCKNRKNNKSGKKGVSKHKGGYWRARIMVGGKEIFLGLFLNLEEAAKAYAAASRTHFGEFGRTA
jgi:hypothetical protein